MGLGAVPIFNLVRYWKSYRACAEGDTLPWDADTVLVLKDERKWRVGVWIGLRAALFAALFLALTCRLYRRYGSLNLDVILMRARRERPAED